MNHIGLVRWFIRAAGIVLLAITMVGCSDLETGYGSSKGHIGRTSINGFGGFRGMVDSAGHRSRDVQALSDRTSQFDAIVWIPKNVSAIEQQATTWMESWLAKGGHTLVYIVPDSGSEVEYWSQTRPLADPDQRLEYRRRKAAAVNQRIFDRAERSSPSSNGWFQLRSLKMRKAVRADGGQWSNDFLYPNAVGSEDEDSKWMLEYQVGPYDDATTGQNSILTNAPPSNNPAAQPVLPGQVNPTTPVYRSNSPTSFEPLLGDEQGNSIIGLVTSDDWPQSKVIIVPGGSMLTNFGLVRRLNQRLARSLINEMEGAATGETDKQELNIAFLETQSSFVPVREAQAASFAMSGMELLSVWPISLVTIHLAIVGMLACLVLLPIFGRPRKLERASDTNFGNHLDAVANLMTHTDDADYARTSISEYIRTVRGESLASTPSRPEKIAKN